MAWPAVMGWDMGGFLCLPALRETYPPGGRLFFGVFNGQDPSGGSGSKSANRSKFSCGATTLETGGWHGVIAVIATMRVP